MEGRFYIYYIFEISYIVLYFRDISDTLLKIFDIKQVFKDNNTKYIIYL